MCVWLCYTCAFSVLLQVDNLLQVRVEYGKLVHSYSLFYSHFSYCTLTEQQDVCSQCKDMHNCHVYKFKYDNLLSVSRMVISMVSKRNSLIGGETLGLSLKRTVSFGSRATLSLNKLIRTVASVSCVTKIGVNVSSWKSLFSEKRQIHAIWEGKMENPHMLTHI